MRGWTGFGLKIHEEDGEAQRDGCSIGGVFKEGQEEVIRKMLTQLLREENKTLSCESRNGSVKRREKGC